SHGLIVGAGDPAAALALYRDVEARLQDGPDLADDEPVRAQTNGGVMMESAALTRFANDEEALARWRDAAPYPDHVVFLGQGAPAVDTVDAAQQSGAWAIVRGRGAWVSAHMTSSASDMIEAMARIDARVPRGVALRSLSADECRDILGYDMEDHRL